MGRKLMDFTEFARVTKDLAKDMIDKIHDIDPDANMAQMAILALTATYHMVMAMSRMIREKEGEDAEAAFRAMVALGLREVLYDILNIEPHTHTHTHNPMADADE